MPVKKAKKPVKKLTSSKKTVKKVAKKPMKKAAPKKSVAKKSALKKVKVATATVPAQAEVVVAPVVDSSGVVTMVPVSNS